MYKKLFSFLFLSMVLYSTAFGSFYSTSRLTKEEIDSLIPESFVSNFHITEQTPQDLELIPHLQQLFFEMDDNNRLTQKRNVYTKAIKEHGGQEVVLLTDDNMRISSLYFKRQNAPINLIYIPGYFFDLTPTKEWGAPFAKLFEEFNVMIIDSRGAGDSEGGRGFFHKNAFGKNAYPDIQAALDFMRKENDKPTILVGFCFGAAMVLHATIQAQKEGKRTADALVLNCIFNKFENQFGRAAKAEDRPLQRAIIEVGIARLILEMQLNGSLFEMNPIDMIQEIKIPCYFEHFTYDPFAILPDAIEVYNKAKCPKMFMTCDIGRHVRLHTKVPYQYREAFLTFLRMQGFLQTTKIEDLVIPEYAAFPQAPVAA
jgi:pimeloyl-ACP methyl ester carboxylesterase